MKFDGLTSGEEFLRDAACRCFEDLYENPMMHVNQELHKDLAWTPALRFVIHEHINVFVEPSEIGPYPRILERKHTDVLHFPQPIAIYAVCPEETIATPPQRSDMKRLQAHGFGLITVNHEGQARREFSAIPLVQVIPKAEYKAEIEGLPKKTKQRIGEAYEDYNAKPVNGVKSLTEVIEGLVTQAGKGAVQKKYLSKSVLGSDVADILDALHDTKECKNARAAIGGVRSHVKEYRNPKHHWPANKKRAYKKYSDCRHAFMDGIKHIQRFRTAMQAIGLTGNLPKN